MTTHAKLSPSKRHRWAVCPGSVREEAKYPEQDSGPAAIDGTHSHTLLEYCVKAWLADPTSMVGTALSDQYGEFVIDADRAARVKVAVDYINTRIQPVNGISDLVLAEARVDPQWFTHRDDLGGTVDCQIVTGDVLEIIDFKDGMGVVDVEGNHQLEQYAIGKLAEYKLGVNVPEQYPVKEVWMTIIQPKLALKGMQPITTYSMPVKHLLDRVATLSNQARLTDDPNAPLVPGESQCKFCRAKGACPALASKAMTEIGVMFQPVTELAQQSADKDPVTLSDDQIRQIMEAAPLVRQLIEGVEAEALRRLNAGQSIEGLKLVSGRGARSWAQSEEETADKLIKMGVPKSAVFETKLITPAKAEKLTWEKRDGTKVALTDRQLSRLNNEYVVKTSGKPTVALESDGRPAITTNAAPLFSAVQAAPAAVTLPSWLS